MVRLLSETQGEGKTAKKDIRSLVAIIPPPKSSMVKQLKPMERRVRLRYSGLVKHDELRIPKVISDELGIKDVVRVVVSGKKVMDLKAAIDDSLPPNEVLGNPEVMRSRGIADNSVVTIRGT